MAKVPGVYLFLKFRGESFLLFFLIVLLVLIVHILSFFICIFAVFHERAYVTYHPGWLSEDGAGGPGKYPGERVEPASEKVAAGGAVAQLSARGAAQVDVASDGAGCASAPGTGACRSGEGAVPGFCRLPLFAGGDGPGAV